MEFVQMPMRFLLLTSFATSFLSASILTKFKKKQLKIFALILGILFIIYSKPLLVTIPFRENLLDKHSYEAIRNSPETTTVGKYELLPKWVTENSSMLAEAKRIQWPNITTVNGCNRYYIETNFSEAKNITLPIFYFPGWTVLLNDAPTQIYSDHNGLTFFHVPNGQIRINVRFEDTLIRKLAKTVTIFSFFLFIGIIAKPLLKRSNIIVGPNT
jgi:hypothetical protein